MKKYVFVLYLCISGICSAQTGQAELDKFNAAFRKNIEKLEDVYSFRGASFICDYGRNGTFEPVIFDFLKSWDLAPERPLLIFYSKSADSLFIWLFADNSVHYHGQQISHQELVSLENKLRASISVENARGYKKWKNGKLRGSNLSMKKGKAKSWKDITTELTDVLLPAELRPYMIGKGHLFVLPELNIGQIPFWLLTPYGNGAFLADSMSFSFVPHVCGFTEFIESKTGIGASNEMYFNDPLIIGNPSYDSRLGLSALPGAESEARSIAEMMKAEALTGGDADLNKVKKRMKMSDILYFATHASCSMENILDSSWIAFAPNSTNDGRLFLREVQRMMLDCDMAVLSACQTGYGLVMEGGFVGLGRAFFKAGVDFTTMSLWSVNDEATSYLMVQYMLNVGQSHYYQPAEPLRKAITETRKKYPHPAFWAPFVLFGFTY